MNSFWRFIGVFAMIASLSCAQDASSSPELKTHLAKEAFVGHLEAGQDVLVLALQEWPSGERFAFVQIITSASPWRGVQGWYLLPDNISATVGEILSMPQAAHLFNQPLVEEDDSDWLNGEIEDSLTTLGLSSSCAGFVNSKGQLGSWGRFLQQTLSRSRQSTLFSNSIGDQGRVCPRFGRMTDAEKEDFYVWLVASMANYESSCRPSARARGVNGTAAGLLQLHLHHEHLYGCRRGMNSLNPHQNIECGLTILNADIARTKKFFPGRNNYWEVLRPHTRAGKATLKLVKSYMKCY